MAPYFVYLCKGQTVVIPEVKRVVVQDDKILCLDEHDSVLARFPAREVYMCASKPISRAPA